MPAQVLWESRENLYSLMLLRATIGKAAFASEKQNSPMNPELCEWDDTYFDYPGFWFEKWPEDILFKVTSLDPSKGKSDRVGDYSAFVNIALARNGLLYVDADIQRRPTPQIVIDCIEHFKRFKPDAIVIETNNFQELLLPDFKRAAEPEKLVLPIHGIDNMVNKEVRIRRIGPYLAQRKLRFKVDSKGAKLLVQQLKDFGVGDYDDGCFVAGTMVETITGPKPIEDIQPGEMVLTRTGYSQVLLAGCTGLMPTIAITANGRNLVGTASHPVFDGFSFTRMRSASTLWECKENTPQKNLNSLCLTTSISGDTRTPSNGRIRFTTRLMPDSGSKALAPCIRRYGSRSTALFQRTTKSITRTKTRSTTRLKTSNAFRRLSTSKSIEPSIGCGIQRQSELRNSNRSVILPPLGTARQRVRRGIKNTARNRGLGESQPLSNASSAGRNAKASPRIDSSSATQPVVSAATQPRTAIRPVSVSAIAPSLTQPVFNLTVEAGEYFANRFLVHNCDSLEMGLRMLMRMLGGKKGKRDEPKPV